MLKPGVAVDRYLVESLLGEGGMGAVYRAHDPRLDRTVALKVVHLTNAPNEASRAEATARLLREARAAAKIDHPNAIGIYDVGEADGDAFIAMELVEGRTLRAMIGDASFATQERLRALTDVARALAAAHAKGIVHRDVKPENIMVRRDGGVKVLDFGIARRSARDVDPNAPTESDALLTLTAKGVSVGTPLYMTPEQIRGDPLDGRSDQFAWGVVAWEVFAGSVPWSKTADAMALAGSILLEPAGSLRKVAPQVTPELEAVIKRALAKAPGDRFASMDELVAELERCARGPVASTPPPAREEAAPRVKPAPAAAGPRYSTEMGRAILSRALERQAEEASKGGYDAEDILEAAREVGVDEATVRAAAREVEDARAGAGAGTEGGSRRSREVRKFLQHVVSYAAVVTFMIVMFGWWMAKWVVFGWGIGIITHAAKAFFGDLDEHGRSERRRERREKRHGRDRERAKPRDEVELGADELLTTAARRRVRVTTSTPAARVAVVEEAAASEEAAEERRQARRL